MQWPVCINNCRTNVCYTLQFVFAIIAFRCIRLNKCIGENTKGTDRQSPNSIRKTKNTFYRTQVTDPLPKFCKKKLLLHTKFHWDRAAELWPKTIFNDGHTPSWVLKIFAFVIWLSSSSKCAVAYPISSKSDHFPLRYWDMAILLLAIWRPCAILNFRNLEFMLCDPYRHAILFPCAKFHWN